MYIQFPDRLNAQINVHSLWKSLRNCLACLVGLAVQQYRLRKATKLLAELDGRLLRDIGMSDATSHHSNAMTSQDPRVLAFSMQMLRAP